MSKLSKLAAGSGIVLTGLNLKIACDAMGQAEAKLEKNQIFAETLGGLFFGGGFGLVVVFISGPVGWVAALVLAGGSIAYGSLGKRIGKSLYDLSGRKVDLVSVTGVSHLCR